MVDVDAGGCHQPVLCRIDAFLCAAATAVRKSRGARSLAHHRHVDLLRDGRWTAGRVRDAHQPQPARARSAARRPSPARRSEEQTSELQSLMSITNADFCLKKKKEN